MCLWENEQIGKYGKKKSYPLNLHDEPWIFHEIWIRNEGNEDREVGSNIEV